MRRAQAGGRLMDTAHSDPRWSEPWVEAGWDADKDEDHRIEVAWHCEHLPGVLATHCERHGARPLLQPLICTDTVATGSCCARTPSWAGATGEVGGSLDHEEIRKDLEGWYVDQSVSDRVRGGFSAGFREVPDDRPVWYDNHPSASDPGAAASIRATIADELEQGRVTKIADGVHDAASFHAAMRRLGRERGVVSPMAAVAKSTADDGTVLKWRQITDLTFSRPGELPSLNDRIGIKPDMAYPDVRHLLRCLRRMRARQHHAGARGPILAFKVDIDQAYRNLFLTPEDAELVLFAFEGSLYRHNALPFGLRSSGALFARVQHAVQAVVLREVHARAAKERDPLIRAALLRYELLSLVDDTVYAAEAIIIPIVRAITLSVHKRWRFPVQLKKLALEGTPAETVKWSGITVDIKADTIAIDPERRSKVAARLEAALAVPGDEAQVSKRELERIHGHLSWLTLVYPLETPHLFVLRGVLRAGALSPPTRRYRVERRLRAEFEHWVAVLRGAHQLQPQRALTGFRARETRRFVTDASGAVGMAGVAWEADGTVAFWHHAYTAAELAVIGQTGRRWNINTLELVAFYAWLTVRPPPVGSHVEFVSDNLVSVGWLRSHRSRTDEVAAAIMLGLVEMGRSRDWTFFATHIPTEENRWCDAGSRTPQLTDFVLFLNQETQGLDVRLEHCPLASSPLSLV